MKIALILALGIIVLMAAQLLVSSQFLKRITRLQQRLVATQIDPVSPIGKLPEIVRAFAEKSGAVVASPAIVKLTQSVSMRLAPDRPWQSLSATHLAGTRTSGFVWHATGSMMHVPVGVIDAYVDGAGVLNARLLNSISVANSTGIETDRGELLRYLAEIPLTPDTILNNPELAWDQIDESTVSVTAHTKDGPVIVEFSFDDQGDIVEAFAPSRPMSVKGGSVDTPWRGKFFDYRKLGPRRIPTRAEVGWELPDGFYLYFRGTIDSYVLE